MIPVSGYLILVILYDRSAVGSPSQTLFVQPEPRPEYLFNRARNLFAFHPASNRAGRYVKELRRFGLGKAEAQKGLLKFDICHHVLYDKELYVLCQ